MVVSDEEEKEIDTTENCFEEILEQKNMVNENLLFEKKEILQEIPAGYDFDQKEKDREKEKNFKEETENFDIITEKQYNLFENFSAEKEDEKETFEIKKFESEKEETEKIEKEDTEKEILKEENINQEIVREETSAGENISDENCKVSEEEKLSETDSTEEIKTFNPMDIIEETEIIDERNESNETAEEIFEETKTLYEPKTVICNFTKEIGKFETALEIKYTSLKLSKFPIKISNVPEGMTFPDQVVIGNTDIKIGEETIKNCHLKVLSNESVKLLEIKNREFKLAVSVSLEGDTMKNYGSVRVYEISSLIKYSRMLKVLEMFEKIFNGAVISFKAQRLYGDIEAEDRIELMKIKTIQNFFGTLEKSGYKFQADKLPESENIYYLLELYTALKENRIIETWCNFNLKNENFDLREKDFLIVKRKHRFDKNLVIEEKITLKAPLDKESIFKDKAVGYRKLCTIELSKAEN